MIRKFFKGTAALGVVAAALLGARTAAAADCSTLNKPLYITGSSAGKPFFAAIGKALTTASSYTVIYKGQGSCLGPDAIVNGTKMTGTASYWDATGAELTCTLASAGQVADVGVSDVYIGSCIGLPATVPTDVGDFYGPNQVMNFVVPVASSQTVISAAAAYFVFGFGATGAVDPWTDEAFHFIRNQNSGTQSMLSQAIKVPANKWKGIDSGGSGAVLTSVSASTSPEKTIGILSSDVADPARDKIKILAYQHFGQSCGYWPDKTTTSFDKINVRDGHYPLWGPLHLFAKIGTDKKPTLAEAKDFVGYFTGDVTPPTGVVIQDLAISAHTVPQCAMKVSRTAEIGDLSVYTPAAPCGCYFESKTGGTACKTCTGDTDCSGGKCRLGYCEAK